MQKAEIVLSIMKEKTKNNDFVFSRIYRNFFNYGFYQMFDREYTEEEIKPIINDLRREKFFPDSSNKSDIVFKILKSLIETVFHFRYLSDIRHLKSYNVSGNLVKIDIKDIYINIDDLFTKILSKKIADTRFLMLTEKFNCAGFFSNDFKIDFCFNYIDYLLFNNSGNSFYRVETQILLLTLHSDIDFFSGIFNYTLEIVGSGGTAFSVYEVFLENNMIRFIINNENSLKMVKCYSKGGKPHYIGSRIHFSVNEIIRIYNDELRSMKNLCDVADNGRSVFKRFKYFNYYSMIKTIGRKENISDRKVISKRIVTYSPNI